MYVAALKEQIQALPNEQFVRAWECIEEIEASLEKAGPTAVLALTYVRALQEKHLAELLGIQQARIANMTQSALQQHGNLTTLLLQRDVANAKIAKLERKLARLTPAKKTKRKA